MQRIKYYVPKAYLEINQQNFRLIIITTAQDKHCVLAEYIMDSQHLLNNNRRNLLCAVQQVQKWLSDFYRHYRVKPQIITVILNDNWYNYTEVEQDLVLNTREIMMIKSTTTPETVLLKNDPTVSETKQCFFRKIIGYQIGDKFTQKLVTVKHNQKFVMIVRNYYLSTVINNALNFLIQKIKLELDHILPVVECLGAYYSARVACDQIAGFVVWHANNIKFGLLLGPTILKYNFDINGFTKIFQNLAHKLGCEQNQIQNLLNHCLPDNNHLPISSSFIRSYHSNLLLNWKENFATLIKQFKTAWANMAAYINQQLENWNQNSNFPIFYSGSALNWNHLPNFAITKRQNLILDQPEQLLFEKNCTSIIILGAIRYEQRCYNEVHLIKKLPQINTEIKSKKWVWFQFNPTQTKLDYYEQS